MLAKLREATRQLHEDLEKENLATKIISHRISLEEYKLLLLQNYIAYKFTEVQISEHLKDWESDKSMRLKKDLDGLNVGTSVTSDFENKFFINTPIEALGAAYVVEGSALGGMQIAKELGNCPELSAIQRPHFFTCERQSMAGWNKFLKRLRKSDFSEEDKEIAAQKARETFQFFGKIFKLTSASVKSD